jgi:simple sugar transport system ATP-binding protein
MTTTGDELSGERPVLELRGMTKRFVDVVACDGVDLALRPGEIHGILGENGAGKSTLMRMIIGLVIPDAGSMLIDGAPAQIVDPIDAARRGIGMVHQHYSLVDDLTVWENVALGEHGPIDRDETRRRIQSISLRYGLEVHPDTYVRDLSAGIRQRVEIVKCLRHEPRILILDEPTSVLTPAESRQLFDVLGEGVRREGWAVALVSHKLDEVLQASDRITIMRDGKVVDRVETSSTDVSSLARAMVGRDVALRSESFAVGAPVEPQVAETRPDPTFDEPPVLEIDDAAVRAADGAVLLDGLSVRVRPGEIVGVAGVEENGQTTLARVLSSLIALDRGTVRVNGVEVQTGKAGTMRRAGIAAIPADRYDSGCIPEMTVAENLVLAHIDTMADRGIIRREEISARAAQLIDEFDIHTPGHDVPFAQLSGGNQQRAVLAGALSNDPMVLIAHQPTRGLDVGAVEYVADRLRRAAASGIGVLLLSTDLAEIEELSDRVVVIHRGRIIGEMDRASLDADRLALLIGGSSVGEPAS